jgi:hypothetical protein
VLDEPRGVQRAEYALALPAQVRGLHDAGDYLELLDASERPVLRFHPSVARDAAGRSRRGTLELGNVERTGPARYTLTSGPLRIATAVDLGGLEGPVVVDPGWSSTGSMATARTQHTSVLLPTGKLLVQNGLSTGPIRLLNSAELYDPATGTWAATADGLPGGNYNGAALLPSGRVLSFNEYGTLL